MRTESCQVPPGDPGTERLLVLLLLRTDHPRWSCPELEADLYDVDRDTIWSSLAYLAAVGVVVIDRETVEASPAARRIDALCMIGI
jgi:hypothetical protein